MCKGLNQRPWLVDARVGATWRTRACATEDEAITMYRAVSADMAQAVNAGTIAEGETVLSDPMGRLLVRWTMRAPQVLS
jgi:hypothetical protein